MSLMDTVMEMTERITYASAAIALGGILILMTLRILSRNFEFDLAGLQLYAQALGVWLVFIVAGALGREGRHIEIGYFTDRLPASIQPYHTIAVNLLSIAMCAVLAGGSLLAIHEFWGGTSPSVNIPLPLYYVPVIIGLTVLAVVYFQEIVTEIRYLNRNQRE
jgi:TRAP-type C4-dicarboxylate transport system permease small subunit